MRTNRYLSEQPADVFMEKSAVEQINSLVYRDPMHECGGILIGNISRDEVTGRYMVYVQEVYAENLVGTGSTFEFTVDYLMNAVRYVKRNCPHSHIIGNIHSHAGFPAFFSNVDDDMMRQARENAFYLVVSPSHGTWEARFKDMEFGFHACEIRISDGTPSEEMFARHRECHEDEVDVAGKKARRLTFRSERYYSNVQKKELAKRFLHSVQRLKGKKVLVVGAGTIGNLIVEYAIHSGVSDLTIVDMDQYAYWNLPRSSMITSASLGRSKALELARAAADRACFPVTVTGIHANIYDLGWGFFESFDLVISPVDSVAARQFIDRGCRLYHIPHITCGTGTIGESFTGNVISFPEDAAVDLEYVWGNAYRQNLEERRSCSDIRQETQPQVMGFSAQIAGITMDLALKYLLNQNTDRTTVWKYVLNSVGCGYECDQGALRTFKYGKRPETVPSELYDTIKDAGKIFRVTFDPSRPKGELWKIFHSLFGDDTISYRLNLEWSMNFPIAYHSADAYAWIEVPQACGPDPLLRKLPKKHIYLVEGEDDYLVELTFEGN